MASKKILGYSAVATFAVLALLLYRGFDVTIKPEQLEPGMNTRLPIAFRIDTSSHVDFESVAKQVMPRDCDQVPEAEKLECLFRNVFITPILKVITLLPILIDKWLQTARNTVSIPVTIERFENVRMDNGGNISVTGYILIHTPFTGNAELPVDITLTTHADVELGLIELNSQLSHKARDYMESWKAVLTLDTLFSAIPINFSDPRLRFPEYEPSSSESSSYIMDLNKEIFWFSFLKPFLKDIELDRRGITLSYGL